MFLARSLWLVETDAGERIYGTRTGKMKFIRWILIAFSPYLGICLETNKLPLLLVVRVIYADDAV